MGKFTIPKDIEKDADLYLKDVLSELEERGVLEEEDSAALTMLARNYSMFIKASKQLTPYRWNIIKMMKNDENSYYNIDNLTIKRICPCIFHFFYILLHPLRIKSISTIFWSFLYNAQFEINKPR